MDTLDIVTLKVWKIAPMVPIISLPRYCVSSNIRLCHFGPVILSVMRWGMLLSGEVRIWAFKLRSKRFCRLLQGMENLESWQMPCWLGIGNVANCFWRSSVQCMGCGASYGRLSPCRQNCAANDWRRISINSLISSTSFSEFPRHQLTYPYCHSAPILD